MCGRAILISGVEEIAELFGVSAAPIGPFPIGPIGPRFNVAPGQDVAVVRSVAAPPSSFPLLPPAAAGRELALVRWGLVPWWSKDGKTSGKTIQARGETVARAPAFRDAFKSRRCLVILDGFYEWSGTGKSRRPHHVKLADGGPFAVGGVWDRWSSPEGVRLETCAVVTTAAQGPIGRLHDRMPLVLDRHEHDRWLEAPPGEVSAILEDARARQALAERFVVTPVSTWVNDVRHDDARCLEPAADPPEPAQTTLRFG